MMYNRAVDYVMWFMASHFKALFKLITQVYQLKSPHPVSQSIVAPMRILNQDEKYTEANIEILEQIMSDAQLKGDPQVCRYAGMTIVWVNVCTHTKSHTLIRITCKNMCGAKLWRLPEINPVHRLQKSQVPFFYMCVCVHNTYITIN